MVHNQIIPLSNYGLISCYGASDAAEKFLQGQLTCDVKKITTEQTSLSCYCDHKGRVQATLRIFLAAGIYYLSLPQAILPPTLNELKKFGLFSKVTLEDVTSDWQQYALIGSDIAAQLQTYFTALPEKTNELIQKDDLLLIRVSAELPIFLLLAKHNAHLKLFETIQANALVSDENQWDLWLIKLGIAKIYLQTIGLFTPHALNYQELDAISFTKGCYRGQEIVARMHYLGKLKYQLMQATVTTSITPEPGSKLMNAEQHAIGEIIMVAHEKPNQYHLLITVAITATTHDIYLTDSQAIKINLIPLKEQE